MSKVAMKITQLFWEQGRNATSSRSKQILVSFFTPVNHYTEVPCIHLVPRRHLWHQTLRNRVDGRRVFSIFISEYVLCYFVYFV